MARTVPWYFPHERVYHNNTECEAGAVRHAGGAHEGTRGKRLCPECMTLNALHQDREFAPELRLLRRSP